MVGQVHTLIDRDPTIPPGASIFLFKALGSPEFGFWLWSVMDEIMQVWFGSTDTDLNIRPVEILT